MRCTGSNSWPPMRLDRLRYHLRKVAVVAAFAQACAYAPQALAQAFSFAAFGDIPYTHLQQDIMREMIRKMGDEPLAFVMHVGDIKAGSSPCDNAVYAARKADFMASRHALIFIPGDNDWSDCNRRAAGSYNPYERLAYLRQVFYADGKSLGQRPIALNRQANFPENQAWRHNGVQFITLNLPGPNNMWLTNSAAARALSPDNAEFKARNAANLAWLAQHFPKPGQAAGVVVAFQANPDFERARRATLASRQNQQITFSDGRVDGFADIRAALVSHSQAFAGPVLVVHGDTHQYRVDQPVKDDKGEPLANVTRLEVHGSPFTGWARVRFDASATPAFKVAEETARLPESR
jgi:hypothetical protein